MSMLPGFAEIPKVKVNKNRRHRRDELFLYCEKDGVMYFYWHKGYSDHKHYEIVPYGQTRKKPKRFRCIHTLNEHLQQISDFAKDNGYSSFKTGKYKDIERIAEEI